MKKLLFMIMFVVLVLVFAGCGHEHTFGKATCLEPQTCTECGATNGTVLGHAWMDATCQATKTCERCDETQDEKIDHDVMEGKCSMCGLDYYEELVSLFKKHGVYKEDTVGQTTSRYYIIRKENVGNYDNVYIGFSETDSECYARVLLERKALKADIFYLDKYGTATKKYNWIFDAMDLNLYSKSYEISGQIYAPDYSPQMHALSYSHSNYDTSSKAGDAAEDAADMLEAVLEMFSELLSKSEHNITLAHYGFEYYK